MKRTSSVKRNTRVFLAAAALAIVTAVPIAWPNGWSTKFQLIVVVPFTVLSVILVELERRARVELTETDLPPAPPGVVPNASPTIVRHATPGTDVGSTAPLPNRSTVVEQPLLPSAPFRGRTSELAAMLTQYRSMRQRLEGLPSGRPVLLLIHGKPGVGKSVMAMELARQLAAEHPSGQYLVKLGDAGDPLSPGEALRILVDQLGWREEVSNDAGERAKLFRALTAGKRALFVLDSARDHSQILVLLPTGSECTVIVTSRRNLGPALGTTSWLLNEPNIDQALDIFHAIADTGDFTAPECATEIVVACGRHPLAIQSAAERVSQDRTDICNVANLLRPLDSRLERLTSHGRSFEQGIRAQYEQLDATEQKAFRLLSLVSSETFVPWVLAPLLDVSVKEAEAVTARLANAQLLDVAGSDRATGLARYQLAPLARLFAEKLLDADGNTLTEREPARARLTTAYRWVLAEVLQRRHPGFTLHHEPPPPTGLHARSALASAVARDPWQWIRTELGTMVDSVVAAHRDGEWALCWRVGIWLGESFPARGTVDPVLRALGLAYEAAIADGSQDGAIDVQLARGGCLIAAERYAEATEVLQQAQSAAQEWRERDPAAVTEARRREGRSSLLWGEGSIQMRYPREAQRYLSAARLIFDEIGDRETGTLTRTLEALNYSYNSRPPDIDQARLPDRHRFWGLVERAEEHRRLGDWATAETHLVDALECCRHDGRRQANVLYRLGRISLDQVEAESGDQPDMKRTQLIRTAVRRATQALLAFMEMANPLGEIRARCLLVRVLSWARHLAVAEEHLVLAERKLRVMEESPDRIPAMPLRARLEWSRGILLMQTRPDDPATRHSFLQASSIFEELGDARSRQQVQEHITRLLALRGPERGTGHALPARVSADGDGTNRSVAAFLEGLLQRQLSPAQWRAVQQVLDSTALDAKVIEMLRKIADDIEPTPTRLVRRLGGPTVPAPGAVRARVADVLADLGEHRADASAHGSAKG